jgi:solute carrier family 25 aspartate/glutamate transporter 12/13
MVGPHIQAIPQHQQQSHQSQTSFLRSLGEKLLAGAIAGIVGTSATFPLDLVKTRLQSQKPGPDGKLPYKGIIDCFRKTYLDAGLRGMYRGLAPVLVGITPEKAIKLGVNDFVLEVFRRLKKKNMNSVPELMFAGATAGMCQFVATNPMEIVKIRMQMQRKQEGGPRLGALGIVRELGVRGLYTGGKATLLRDIPFSIIYFGFYGFLKQKWTDVNGQISTLKVFVVSCIAGTIAASSVTPADVIKTRLQAKTPPGQEPYKGVIDCFTRTVRAEGFRALFKGVLPRVMVISPLFGIALAVFELQKKIFAKYFK